MSGILGAIKKGVGSLTGRNDMKSAQRDAANAASAAQAEQTRIEGVRQQQQLALQNMQANAALDLSTDNLTSVVAGGTADLSPADPSGLKKKRPAGSLASSLGLNV